MVDRKRQPNTLLRKARGGMSQAQLADLVSAEIYHATGKQFLITAKAVSDWECGWYTWPRAEPRTALCRVLGKSDPADLGFYKQRMSTKPVPASVSLVDLIAGQSAAQPEALRLPAGRSYSGVEIGAHYWPVELPGDGWLMVDPGKDVSLNRPDRRSLVIVTDHEQRHYASDGRRFVDRGSRRTGLQPISSAALLDDLTVGIIWSTTNTDVALLADDGQLTSSQARLAHHEGRRTSDVSLTEVPTLNAVAGQWLGSRFCARHITRNLDRLSDEPFFWTRENRGEEAASWLLWRHKFEYLRRTSRWFPRMRRGFCITEADVAESPTYERVLLLLAAALMEAFGITVAVSAEPEHAQVEGFVLADDAIVANWLGGSGLWYVDASAPPSHRALFRELSDQVSANSVVGEDSAGRRLEALASYLNVPWQWFLMRCQELAVAGVDDIAHPRSRLLSTRGLDTAIRYVAYLNDPRGADFARR
ncbi:XRE family transcriptional regulator [Kribbella speibonae]|uniref:XRE family transcriptional regulator n=1 Tax=Kribbella speibonae TaxID=1572660 RepID=A0A4R0JBD4_9ACTN|nr:XRE family transcriptional regulator [Kribbella speibonae]TCC38875.1 XRE family transcriptional regulator [Kribbella speibonae]